MAIYGPVDDVMVLAGGKVHFPPPRRSGHLLSRRERQGVFLFLLHSSSSKLDFSLPDLAFNAVRIFLHTCLCLNLVK
jgi:hypothetical protein